MIEPALEVLDSEQNFQPNTHWEVLKFGCYSRKSKFFGCYKRFFFSNGSMLACTVVALHAGNGEWTLLGSGRRGSQDDDRGLVGAEHVDARARSLAHVALLRCSVLSPLRWCECTTRAET